MAKSTTPYKNEDQVDVPSRFDPATFASHPEMDAYQVTDELLERLQNNPYQFIVVNFANGDMVGHTGDMDAATQAIEVVDECVGKIVDRLLELDANILITADHGNSEQMIDYQTGMTKTSHTLNPVEINLRCRRFTGQAADRWWQTERYRAYGSVSARVGHSGRNDRPKFNCSIIDGLVKSPFCSLSDHLGAFQAVLLNFKNSSQAPQTA